MCRRGRPAVVRTRCAEKLYQREGRRCCCCPSSASASLKISPAPVAFLLSKAAPWITGQTPAVDGGLLAQGGGMMTCPVSFTSPPAVIRFGNRLPMPCLALAGPSRPLVAADSTRMAFDREPLPNAPVDAGVGSRGRGALDAGRGMLGTSGVCVGCCQPSATNTRRTTVGVASVPHGLSAFERQFGIGRPFRQ